jgi:hypothetical protein
VLTLRTALPSPKYDLTPQSEQFYDRVLSAVRALPGVQAAGYISGLPMIMRGGIWPATIAGKAIIRDASNSASLRFVTPQYFAALGIPIREGRDVAESDTRSRLPWRW